MQSKIDAASDVLNLSYGFAYDGDVDSGIADGIHINKNLVIEGNGNTISGSNSVHMLFIGQNCNVTLNNIAFVDGYCINNGGAIYSEGNLTVNDCTFTNCRDDGGYAIYNDLDGTLSLRGNNVDGIIYNGGTITSETTAVVLENRTHDVLTKTYDLIAELFDDSRNHIYDPDFKFLVNGVEVEFASYDRGAYKYEEYAIVLGQTYLVSAKAPNEEVLTAKTAVIWNLKGTFTDLQSRIDAASRSVTLPYDFTYNGEVDNHDNLNRGIHFSNVDDSDTFTVWGNHHTVSGNNSASIFHIGEYDTVVLNGVTMLDGYYSDNGGAVYSIGDLNLIGCTIANCRDDENNAVYSENGTLRLEHNTVQGGVIYIANLINSQTHAVVLENRDHDTYDATYNLTAMVVDDDGNIIHNAQFKFIVNGNEVNVTSFSDGVHVCEDYAISPGHVYHVSAMSLNEPGMDVKDGSIMQLNGTFTDLKEQIDTSSGVLDLAYNFTFNSEIDNNELINGISINKDLIVNGHGYTISGRNSASIFDIANHAVILNNITFADGFHSTKGGAVSSNGNLTIRNSTFTNCRNNAGYAIYIAEGTLSLDGNDVKDYIIYNGGEITSPTAQLF